MFSRRTTASESASVEAKKYTNISFTIESCLENITHLNLERFVNQNNE